MRVKNPQVGQVVRSRAGRDQGRLLVISALVDDEYALVVDGALRTLARPKKKKLRHLDATPFQADKELVARLLEGQYVQDAQVRSCLEAFPMQHPRRRLCTDGESKAGMPIEPLKGWPQGKED